MEIYTKLLRSMQGRIVNLEIGHRYRQAADLLSGIVVDVSPCGEVACIATFQDLPRERFGANQVKITEQSRVFSFRWVVIPNIIQITTPGGIEIKHSDRSMIASTPVTFTDDPTLEAKLIATLKASLKSTKVFEPVEFITGPVGIGPESKVTGDQGAPATEAMSVGQVSNPEPNMVDAPPAPKVVNNVAVKLDESVVAPSSVE